MNKILLSILLLFLGTSLFAQAPLKRPAKPKQQKAQVAKSQSQPAKPKQTRGTINGHEWVDLGLPSGVKWATCNVGANSPEGYGYKYAWGETTAKKDYTYDNYKWFDNEAPFTKYYPSDHLTVLEKRDDAAYVNWGGSWRMPTRKELEELRTMCHWKKIEKRGVWGMLVSGPNGNTIFLPVDEASSKWGHYWSASLNMEYYAYAYYATFYTGKEISINCNYCDRIEGFAIRAVSN